MDTMALTRAAFLSTSVQLVTMDLLTAQCLTLNAAFPDALLGMVVVSDVVNVVGVAAGVAITITVGGKAPARASNHSLANSGQSSA